jgi:hypothetical protein
MKGYKVPMYPDEEIDEYEEYGEKPREKDEYKSLRPKFHTGPKSNKQQILQKKEFKTSMGNFSILTVIVFLVYCYIFYQVQKVLSPLPDKDSLKLGGMLVCLLLGVVILTFVIIISYFNRNKTLIFTPDSLEFIHGNVNFEAKWKAVIFSKSSDKSLYRVGTIMAGRRRVQIDNLFFPKYDMICNLLEKACEASTKTGLEL